MDAKCVVADTRLPPVLDDGMASFQPFFPTSMQHAGTDGQLKSLIAGDGAIQGHEHIRFSLVSKPPQESGWDCYCSISRRWERVVEEYCI